MPCIATQIPSFPPLPPLPSGLSIPVFPGVTFPSLGLCCNIHLYPPFLTPYPFSLPYTALPLAIPTAVLVAYAALQAFIQELYVKISIPCPTW